MPIALIIEDDSDAGETLASLLEERGWTTLHTLTGEEGLTVARSVNPDMIFLDVMLPDVEGYKICEQLKIDRRTNPIPIIMVTALSGPESRAQGLRVGADAYVAKPYSPQQLDEAISHGRQHREAIQAKKIDVAIKFDLASQQENLHAVNELFGMLLRNSNLDEHQASQLRTAMLEAGQNAIEWGNKHDITKSVTIRAEVGNGRIQIDVEDEGEGFNPRQIPHASGSADDPGAHFAVREMLGLREGGFGLQIVRGMMDEVRYNDRGNHVTMIKYLPTEEIKEE